MTHAHESTSTDAFSGVRSEKQRFLAAYEQNHALTAKVLNAFLDEPWN